MPNKCSIDAQTTVIGGGVIGLAIAVAAARKGQEVLLLERNAATGQEVSSRSSEVVHAGLYYPAYSAKAKFCVPGLRKLYQFADENGVSTRRLGKLVVATSPAEVAVLRCLKEAARQNGVEDLRILEPADVRVLEPEIACSAALLSPSSGIIDSRGLMQALDGCLQANGGSVVLKTNVTRVDVLPSGDFEIRFASAAIETTIKTRTVYVAAGLGMAELRERLPRTDGYEPPRIRYAKGHYFSLSGQSPFQRLIYPIPVTGGLGIHLTLDLQGRARFGPDVQWIDAIDYDFDDADGALKASFERSIKRYWPGLPTGLLQPAYTGIRPKLSGPGEPEHDFAIHGPRQHGVSRLVTLYGIDSPGLTSCLEIADYCCSLARDDS